MHTPKVNTDSFDGQRLKRSRLQQEWKTVHNRAWLTSWDLENLFHKMNMNTDGEQKKPVCCGKHLFPVDNMSMQYSKLKY